MQEFITWLESQRCVRILFISTSSKFAGEFTAVDPICLMSNDGASIKISINENEDFTIDSGAVFIKEMIEDCEGYFVKTDDIVMSFMSIE